MPSKPLSFEQSALIGLEAAPQRMLTYENATEEEVIAELLNEASEWPKRTKRQVQLHGRGTPTLRTDLISIALGNTLRRQREHTEQYGDRGWNRYEVTARLLRIAGERAGGLDEALVAKHQAPPPPRTLMNPNGRGIGGP